MLVLIFGATKCEHFLGLTASFSCPCSVLSPCFVFFWPCLSPVLPFGMVKSVDYCGHGRVGHFPWFRLGSLIWTLLQINSSAPNFLLEYCSADSGTLEARNPSPNLNPNLFQKLPDMKYIHLQFSLEFPLVPLTMSLGLSSDVLQFLPPTFQMKLIAFLLLSFWVL